MRWRRVTMALSSLVVSSLSRDISRIFYASAPRLLNDFARQSITIDRGKFDTPGSETSSAQLAPVSPAPELAYGSEETDEGHHGDQYLRRRSVRGAHSGGGGRRAPRWC